MSYILNGVRHCPFHKGPIPIESQECPQCVDEAELRKKIYEIAYEAGYQAGREATLGGTDADNA